MALNSIGRPNSDSVPSRCPRGAIPLWLATAALALLFVPLLGVFDAMLGDLGRLQAAIVEAQVSRVSPVLPQRLASLRASAAHVAAEEETVRATLERMREGGVPWLAVLRRVVPVPPSGVSLTGLTQHEDRLLILGTATSDAALTAYVGRLRGLLLFEDVRLESANRTFAISLRVKGYQR